MLQESVTDVKSRKYLGYITDGAERAQNLISDILAYSSVNTATQKLEWISSMELVDSIKQTMDSTLKTTGGGITYDNLPDIRGNQTQLLQLYQNLINNGIKYQKADATPQIHLSTKNKGEFIEFSVKDNGIGIDQRHIHKIFDVFQRLHRSGQFAGTGIGLSICKKVVERHGGTIRVESEAGIGTTFYFTLPKTITMEIAHDKAS